MSPPSGDAGQTALVLAGAWLGRVVRRAAGLLPYFPDPNATCPAHGIRVCPRCHRNPPPPGEWCCDYYPDTGLHWDTCERRIR